MKHYILVLISALLFSGCSCLWESESDCPMPAAAGRAENITLSFRMISSNIGHTRADGLHEERDSEWPQFEDLINVRDFAFYIFLDNDAEGRKPLVMKMTDISASHNPNSMVTGSYGAYTVTSVIPRESMEKLLGHPLSASSSEPVVFRIVILANSGADYQSLAADPTEVGTNLENVTTYEAFMERAGALLFNLNDIHNPVEGDSGVNGLYKGAIPMFGMGTFTTNEELLYASRTEERIWLGDVFMLRALAKIRVIDNAPTDSEGFPYVKAVSVRSVTDRGYQLPEGADTYSNGEQVHAIRYAAVPEEQTSANTEFRLGYLTKSTPDAKLLRFGYLPEQEIGEGGPVICVTAQLNAETEKTYEIPMTGYNGSTFDFGSIMRNHIYTLSIEKITVDTPAEIIVSVDEWKESETTLDYTEAVTVSSGIQWTPGSYDNNPDPYLGMVKMLSWDASNKSVPLECTFTLTTPSGAKWTAYLIPKEGNTDAFAFIDGEGNTVGTAVSGTVKNTETTLRIVSTEQFPDVLNSAVLQIVVTLGNGTNIEADVTGNKSFKNYTIIQDRS